MSRLRPQSVYPDPATLAFFFGGSNPPATTKFIYTAFPIGANKSTIAPNKAAPG
jgi:hypothetical protein